MSPRNHTAIPQLLDKIDVEDAFLFNKSSDYASQMECGHERIETRECRILPADAVEDEEIRTRWNGLKTIVEITSTVDYGNRMLKFDAVALTIMAATLPSACN